MDKLLEKLEKAAKSLQSQKATLQDWAVREKAKEQKQNKTKKQKQFEAKQKAKEDAIDDGAQPKQLSYNQPKEGSYEERQAAAKPGLKPGEQPEPAKAEVGRSKTLGQLTPPKSVQRRVYPIGKSELVKSLEDAGHRESALLLKNWDEYDAIAEEFLAKAKKPDMPGPQYKFTDAGKIKNDANYKGTTGHQYAVHLDGKKIGHATVDHKSGGEEGGARVHGGIDWNKHNVADSVVAHHNKLKRP